MGIVEFTDELMKRLRDRSQEFVMDNIENPTESDFTLIHNAMMVGSIVRGDLEMKKEFDEIDLPAGVDAVLVTRAAK